MLQCFRILSEGNAAFLYIWAGNIDLQQIHRLLRQTLYHLTVIFFTLSADIDDDLRIILLQEGNISFYKYINPRVLQTNGIEHAASGLCDSRCRIARPRHICHTLGHYGTQCSQIIKFTVLSTGSKGSGCSHDWIFKLHTCDGYFCIHYSSTSVLKNTGPSLQTLLLCTWECPSTSFDWQTQARQAPMPQAMRSSMEM